MSCDTEANTLKPNYIHHGSIIQNHHYPHLLPFILCIKSDAKLVLGRLPSSILAPAVASIPNKLSRRVVSLATATLPFLLFCVAAPPDALVIEPRRVFSTA